jgi:hypothetical protein
VPSANIASLLCHPTSPCPTPVSIEVTVAALADGGLSLHYRITSQPEAIRLPPALPPGPADGLWQHTCCEAFVAEAGNGYREFNFSPSGQWAAYRFTGYRERDEAFAPAAEPTFTTTPLADGFALQATLPAALLPPGTNQYIGLTAVLEAADGCKHFWALAHCAPQPDFHLRQSFALILKRPTP